jgi:hypothetical protein
MKVDLLKERGVLDALQNEMEKLSKWKLASNHSSRALLARGFVALV